MEGQLNLTNAELDDLAAAFRGVSVEGTTISAAAAESTLSLSEMADRLANVGGTNMEWSNSNPWTLNRAAEEYNWETTARPATISIDTNYRNDFVTRYELDRELAEKESCAHFDAVVRNLTNQIERLTFVVGELMTRIERDASWIDIADLL